VLNVYLDAFIMLSGFLSAFVCCAYWPAPDEAAPEKFTHPLD
jgi:hypothetical protein